MSLMLFLTTSQRIHVVVVFFMVLITKVVWASHCCWISDYSGELYCDSDCDHSDPVWSYSYDTYDDDNGGNGMTIFLGIFFTLLFLFAFVFGPLWLVHRAMQNSELCWTDKDPIPNGIWSWCSFKSTQAQNYEENGSNGDLGPPSEQKQEEVSKVVDDDIENNDDEEAQFSIPTSNYHYNVNTVPDDTFASMIPFGKILTTDATGSVGEDAQVEEKTTTVPIETHGSDYSETSVTDYSETSVTEIPFQSSMGVPKTIKKTIIYPDGTQIVTITNPEPADIEGPWQAPPETDFTTITKKIIHPDGSKINRNFDHDDLSSLRPPSRPQADSFSKAIKSSETEYCSPPDYSEGPTETFDEAACTDDEGGHTLTAVVATGVKVSPEAKIGILLAKSQNRDSIYISRITEQSIFAGQGLRKGMIVNTINGIPVKTIEQASSILSEYEGRLTIEAEDQQALQFSGML